MNNNIKQAQALAVKAVKAEKDLAKMEQQFALQNAEFAKFLKDQAAINKKIVDMWSKVKQTLIDAEYFDEIENDNFKISVSKVLKIDVNDVNALPEEYTEIIKTPLLNKIKKHYELYEQLPNGAVDASYYRLNKKIK